MVLITIVTEAYKPTYNWGASHCRNHHPIHNGLLPVVGYIPIHHGWKGVAAKNIEFNQQNRDKPSNKGDVTNNKKAGWWQVGGLENEWIMTFPSYWE